MGFFSSLFGGGLKKHPDRTDVVALPRGDAEFKRARAQAMATLRGFIEELQRPVEGTRYLLKVELSDGEEVEHVWLEPVRWINPGLAGILASKPVHLKDFKAGDVIKPLPDEVSDWVILAPDGSRRGGFTVDCIDRRRS